MKTNKQNLKNIILIMLVVVVVSATIASIMTAVMSFTVKTNPKTDDVPVQKTTSWYVDDNMKYRIVENNVFEVQVFKRYDVSTIPIVKYNYHHTNLSVNSMISGFCNKKVSLEIIVRHDFTVDLNRNVVICKDGAAIDIKNFNIPVNPTVQLEYSLPEEILYENGDSPSMNEMLVQIYNTPVEDAVRVIGFDGNIKQIVTVNVIFNGDVTHVEKTN